MALDAVKVLDANDLCPRLPLIDGGGEAIAMVWPGMGASSRSLHLMKLEGHSKTVRMRHPMEAVYYIVSGEARVLDFSDGSEAAVGPGSMIFIEPDTAYEIAGMGDPVRLLGGPCPPDPALYADLALP